MKETLVQLLRQQPFSPFVVQMSNGGTFEIRHPEMAALAKSNLIIASANSDEIEYCALLHVANVNTKGQQSGNHDSLQSILGWSDTDDGETYH